jgi:NAD(P)-dependent dehydrogenase (short-subunit alcohol dehydrogenase family)
VAAEIDGEAEPFVADVSERDSIHAAIARRGALWRHRRGDRHRRDQRHAAALDLVPDEEFERIIRINLLGVWWTSLGCCRT